MSFANIRQCHCVPNPALLTKTSFSTREGNWRAKEPAMCPPIESPTRETPLQTQLLDKVAEKPCVVLHGVIQIRFGT